MGNSVIQMRNNTAAGWGLENPVLALGEIGFEVDTRRIKFGDGVSAWNSLSYISPPSFKYGYYTISGVQSSYASGDHVEFDACQGALGGLSTGVGQERGIVNLPAGMTYKIMGGLRASFSSENAYLNLRIRNETDGTFVGSVSTLDPVSRSVNNSLSMPCLAIISASEDVLISLAFQNALNLSSIYNGAAFLLIEEYAGV